MIKLMNQLVFAIIDFKAFKGINIILILGLLQPMIFMLCPNYLSNSAPWALLIIRPELVLFEYILKWCQLLYLVLALVLLDKAILLLITLRKCQYQIINLYSHLYNNVFLIYLHQPMSTLCVQAIIISFNTQNYGYSGFGLSLFTILQMEAIIRLQLSETLTLRIVGTEKLVVGSLEYLESLLNLMQMVIYTINDNQLALDLQFIILVCYELIQIYKQLSFRSFICNNQIIINIFCISITISISLGAITNYPIYGIIAFPYIAKLLYDEVFQAIYKAQLNPQQSLDTLLLNIIYSINNPQITTFRITAIKAFHIKNCQDAACKCRSPEIHTQQPLSVVMLEEYYLTLIQDLAKYQDTQYTIYWFPSLLMQLGYASQSFKEINRLLNKLPDKFHYINTNRTQTTQIKNVDNQSKQISTYREQPKKRAPIYISNLQRALGELLRKQVLIDIQQAFKLHEGSVIVLAVEQFYRNEANTIRFQNDVIQIIMNRIKFYQSLINNKSIKMIYQNTQSQSEQIDRVELELKQQFEHFPTKRNQSLLCFYQAEILTNILEAYKYQNLSSLQEDRLISLYNNTKINLFQDNISYLYCVMRDDQQTLDITQYGSNFHINYPTISQVTMNEILPRYIFDHHSLLVELFLRTGKSKYYYQFDLSFIQVDDLFVEAINICFSNINNNSRLEFLVFIQKLVNNLAYIIVDVDSTIQNYSIGLFQMMNYSSETIQLMKSQSNLFRLHISDIVTQFEEISDLTQSFNADFRFMNEESIYTYINTKEIHKSMFQNYQTNLKIDKRELFGYYYYIIEVQNLQIKSQLDNPILTTEIRTDRSPSFDESGAHLPHLFNPKLMNTYVNIQSPKIELINSPTQSYQGINLQKIYFDNQNQVMKSQQNYFNDSNLLVNQSESKIEIKSQSQNQKQIDLMYEQSSNESTRTGLRKAAYYSKLEVMTKVISEGVAINLIRFTSLYIFTLLIYIIYGIILIILTNKDISRFANEIDMIAFHAEIMGPQDLFYIKRVTITTYQQYQTSGIINSSRLPSLVNPLYDDIMTGYFELQQSFYKIYQNQQIQTFIIGNIIPVFFMSTNQSFIYNISMPQSEEYYVLIQYLYAIGRIFNARGSTSGTPAQTAQFANFYNQHTQLENITVAMQKDSINRASTVSLKWQFILITFLIVGFVIQALAMHFYHEYLKQYDKYLNLFYLLDNSTLQAEIERQKNLVKQLQINKIIFENYEFSYKQLDSNLMSQKQVQVINVKQKRQFKSLPRLKGYLLIGVMFLIFGIYSIVSYTIISSYLTKYKSTTVFYKLLQDLKYASGNIYVYREIAFRWSQFPFFTPYNWQQNNQMIDNSLHFMSQFMALQSTIQFSDYLVNQSFIDYFNHLKSIPLCSQLDPQYLIFLNRYCNISFSGVLQTGLTQSLNYIINAIQTQRQINNFTSRVEYNFYELEGSQIITRTFFTMSEYYKTILQSITKENSSLIQVSISFSQALSIASILLSCSIILLMYIYIFGKLRQSYYLIKKSLYLFPQYILLTDDMLERQLRIFIIHFD